MVQARDWAAKGAALPGYRTNTWNVCYRLETPSDDTLDHGNGTGGNWVIMGITRISGPIGLMSVPYWRIGIAQFAK